MTTAGSGTDAPSDGPDAANAQSFHEAFVALMPSVRAFAISLCRNAAAADDLAQNALMKAWRARHTFERGTNLRAWLFTILRNQYFSDRRHDARWRADGDLERIELGGAQSQEPRVELIDVQRALGLLPAEQREALVLVGAGGFAYQEAADICGCAIGTIKSRVARARRALAELLAQGSHQSQPRLDGDAATENILRQVDVAAANALATLGETAGETPSDDSGDSDDATHGRSKTPSGKAA